MTEVEHVTTSREDIYRLLAACYYSPNASLFEEDCCASLAILLEGKSAEAVQHARAAADALKGVSAEALAVEHARLFVGPFQLVAPPYGSIYLDETKTVMGDSTARVAAFYHKCGLHLTDDFHELPDHIAVELEFMSFLAFKQREAETSGNADDVAQAKSLQREFLRTFLLPWLPLFTMAVIDDGEAPFYQAIARCSAAFITADYEALSRENHG
jgi:TorA maturation chaperone TorD